MALITLRLAFSQKFFATLIFQLRLRQTLLDTLYSLARLFFFFRSFFQEKFKRGLVRTTHKNISLSIQRRNQSFPNRRNDLRQDPQLCFGHPEVELHNVKREISP